MPYLVGYITPQDYGAVADGVTDDTTAIQAAITAAQTGGKTVFFPSTANSYLLNGVGLTVTADDVSLVGESLDNAKLTIGASFSGAAVVTFTGDNCQVRDLSFYGASTTTTTNPVADAIRITGVRRTKVNRVTFDYINGWCVNAQSTSANGTSNPRGTALSQLYANQCAGGFKFLGNTTQGFQMNATVTDVQVAFGGVTTGGSANLDALRIEDSWDVLVENAVVWLSAGTGSALRIKGNSAASFITNLDALGPGSTGPNVLIEDGASGSPQNTQITGGVIQQGSIGLRITGGATHTRVNTSRIINNTTHGISVESTVGPVYLTNTFFSLNGQGATGSNYDLNWSGAATGSATNCYFASPITSIGVAGVQQSVNIASAQDVMFINAVFSGTSAASTNWFTNTPGGVLVDNNSRFNFRTRVDFSGQIATQPTASGNTALSTNVNGSDTNDRFRLLGSGAMEIGPGSAGRDAFTGRAAAGINYASPTLLVGATTALGDNGVGEIQLHNATTPPTSAPTAGTVIYSQTTLAVPLMALTPNGNKFSVVDALAIAASDQTFTTTSQVASTQLTLAAEISATYLIEAAVIFSNATSGNTVFSWTGPSGATMKWNDTGTSSDYQSTIGGTNSYAFAGGVTRMAFFKGKFIMSTNAGSLTLTVSNSVGTASTSTVLTDSWLRMTRVK